ncbi:hypothetical protein BDEG_22894 [Batrachochytrium dendrobatidis JEL423]|uniref:DNA (Cytosine-5-)-methyltransferase n=1 Tax=Batrachochytrium dendrobatidis (strain JEL423) TaxID=403673 RepID=A0A177WI31_BATDL|nr:hypothetical protein BDEG_22894 [Batrachochytrium dendrobatidis JEL423]
MSASVRALEFFSGIGGMHFGLEWAAIDAKVVAAFDINPQANACYNHNFGLEPVEKSIQDLNPKELERYDANCWLMSPPCQPYTRTGKQLDDKDARAQGFLFLLDTLSQMASPPMYIFIENVANFEQSRTRQKLIDILSKLDYIYQEWLLNPVQFGIPNDRPRYYLTARKQDRTTLPDSLLQPNLFYGRLSRSWMFEPPFVVGTLTVGEFLQNDILCNDPVFKIPERLLRSRGSFDPLVIAKPSHTRTSCFTKAYGHHGVASGAFLQTRGFDQDESVLLNTHEAVDKLGLRLFTSIEIARLHGFPIDLKAPQSPHINLSGTHLHLFSFPKDISTRQQWRVLGNSMCVIVVGLLLPARITQLQTKHHLARWTIY